MNRRAFLGGLLGAAVVSATSGPIPSATGAIREKGVQDTTAVERRRRRFLNVVLRTHEGKEVRFYDDLIKDKIVLINMIQAACPDGSCPLITANLLRVQKLLGERIGRDIFMYSITLDPAHDSPQVLKKYAESFGVKPGWLFLTGKPGDMEALRRRLGFVDPDPIVDADPNQHTGVVRFGIESLERWGACPALTNPHGIVRYLSWIEPQGERPQEWPKKLRPATR